MINKFEYSEKTQRKLDEWKNPNPPDKPAWVDILLEELDRRRKDERNELIEYGKTMRRKLK